MNKNSLVCLSCILSLSTIGVRADDTQEPLVVTATRIPTPQGTALGSTTVITGEDMARAQSPTLVDALQDLGGVQFARNGGPGTTSSVFLRGTNSNQVLVLIDGVRVESATTGTAPFAAISTSDIDRIEIVRGNASSLYGANAVGGVIQIFTKAAARPSAAVSAGTYRTRSIEAGTGNQGDLIDLSAHASYIESDSFSPVDPDTSPTVNPNSHGWRNRSATIKASHGLADGGEVGASYYGVLSDTRYNDPFAASITDELSNEEALGVSNVHARTNVTTKWNSALRYGHTADRYDSLLNGARTGRIVNTQDQVTWQNDIRVRADDHLVLGLEQLQQQVGGDTVYARDSRRIDSVFAGYTANIGVHRLEGSVRRDDYTEFGAQKTASLGYGYAFTTSWEAHAVASTAFKAPTFNDLYWADPSTTGFYVGNPNLQPEKSRNLEAGVRYLGAHSHASLVYFHNRITDLIAYSFPTMVNVNRAQIDGAEVSYDARAGSYRLKTVATVQNPRDIETRKMLSRRSQNYGTLEVGRESGVWYTAVQTYATSKRYDDAANTVPLGGYAVVNVIARYALTPEIALGLRAENVLDRSYQLAKGYNTPGRSAYLSLEYRPRKP